MIHIIWGQKLYMGSTIWVLKFLKNSFINNYIICHSKVTVVAGSIQSLNGHILCLILTDKSIKIKSSGSFEVILGAFMDYPLVFCCGNAFIFYSS